MKNLSMVLSAATLVLAISSSVLAFDAALPSAPTAPSIDGKIDASEWGQAAVFPINYNQIGKVGGTALSTASGWAGEAVDYKNPASVTVRMSWDPKNLYVAGEFIDSNLFFTVEPSGVGNMASSPTNCQDAIQICLDPLADGESMNDVNIIDFTMTPDASQAMYWQHWGDPRAEFAGIKMVAAKTGKGYQFEAAIPWSDFDAPYSPKAGDVLGYGGLLLDVDDGTIVELQCDFGEGENMIGTPSGWNRLTLK